MPPVRLVSWKPEVAETRSRSLREAGFEVDASPLDSGGMASFRAKPPSAVLIDLDRLPSHGREVAVALRQSKWTRHIPIVFAGGLEEKVERIRHELPDAVFSDWKSVERALEKALKHAPANPVQPPAHMERYAGSSLVKKLGLKPAMEVALLGAPDGFEETLGEIPEGVMIRSRVSRKTSMA